MDGGVGPRPRKMSGPKEESAALLDQTSKETPSIETPSIETAQINHADSSFTKRSSSPSAESGSYRYYLEPLFPDVYDIETVPVGRHSVRRISHPRSMKRRLFLILTEPEASFASASFFALLVLTITLMNMVMILQTMHFCQFTPLDCESCGGNRSYPFDNDDAVISPPKGVLCQCPPEPFAWTNIVLQGLVYFFTVEWILRVLSFEPAANQWQDHFYFQWFRFIASPAIVMDALAVFPYYIETFSNSNGLMSLRLLRLFRVLQVVRLGQYNDSFKSLTAVLIKAMPYLKLLVVVLLFGATFFGSMLYWVEKGEWKFFEPTRSFQYVRLDQHGQEEISPFSSIASAFWWFLVTATTVGYGDTYPTSTVGKWIACAAMMMGVLVIAFPVSVFSELWSKELRLQGALDGLKDESNHDEPHSVREESVRHRAQTVYDSITEADHGRQPSLENRFSDPCVPAALTIDDEHLIMRKDDLRILMNHIHDIHESQRQIKGILQKYKLQ